MKLKKSKTRILAAALFPSVFSQTPGSEGNPVIFHNTARDSCSEEQDILKYSLKVSHPRCIGFTMHLDKCIKSAWLWNIEYLYNMMRDLFQSSHSDYITKLICHPFFIESLLNKFKLSDVSEWRKKLNYQMTNLISAWLLLFVGSYLEVWVRIQVSHYSSFITISLWQDYSTIPSLFHFLIHAKMQILQELLFHISYLSTREQDLH